MPQKTKIEWTQLSSNPIYARDRETGKRGWFCTKPSTGCAHCYSEAINRRFGNGLHYAKRNESRVEFTLNDKELSAILTLKKPSTIFLCDMLDLFHENMPDAFIGRVFAVMALSPQHTFQVLTKRPARMLRWVRDWDTHQHPLTNVWCGVSVENQEAANERLPLLLQTPAAVRFLSVEPMLGPVDLSQWIGGVQHCGSEQTPLTSRPWKPLGPSDLVIVGGESGPGARPMAIDWVRSLRDQCRAAGIRFFVKQLSEADTKEFRHFERFPSDIQIREFPRQEISLAHPPR
jgi:protein gp37